MTKAPTRRVAEHRISQLRPQLEAAGVYKGATLYYLGWCGLALALYAVCFRALTHEPSLGVRVLALFGTALAMMQIGLFAHDIGHGAVVRGKRTRIGFEMVANALLLGYGYCYGQDTHNQHHNHPNTEGLDPDQDSKLFALYEGAARGDRGFMARMQPASIFCGLLAWAFAIRAQAIAYCFRNVSRLAALDLALIAIHFGVWLGVGGAAAGFGTMALNYFLVTLIASVYMGAIFVLPHVGTGSWTPADELPNFERQVASARNYSTSLIPTLLCGGLNLQIEHHLLPGIPSPRLRRARRVIRAYCLEHGLPYHETGYVEGWREVVVHTRAMSRLVRAASRAGTSAGDTVGG